MIEMTDHAKVLIDKYEIEEAFVAVQEEVYKAIEKYEPFHSAHEGFSVLNEEVDELWEEVKRKQGERNTTKLRQEAIQVAAMAIRFIHDICNGKEQK